MRFNFSAYKEHVKLPDNVTKKAMMAKFPLLLTVEQVEKIKKMTYQSLKMSHVSFPAKSEDLSFIDEIPRLFITFLMEDLDIYTPEMLEIAYKFIDKTLDADFADRPMDWDTFTEDLFDGGITLQFSENPYGNEPCEMHKDFEKKILILYLQFLQKREKLFSFEEGKMEE